MADIVERVQLMSSVRAECSCGCLTLLMAGEVVQSFRPSWSRLPWEVTPEANTALGIALGVHVPWYQCVSCSDQLPGQNEKLGHSWGQTRVRDWQ